jgi:hypothetical protein
VADAASTGTLILVALSGGGGALLGAVLGQGVQLHRDRRQYEREDARHERERREALEDGRRKRREDRYVALLSEVTRLDRSLDGLCVLLPDLADHRERMDAPEPDARDSALSAVTESMAQACRVTWKAAESQHRDVSDAFLAAHGVASPAVRHQGVLVTDWPMAITSVQVGMLTDHAFSVNVIMEESGHREANRPEYVEYLLERIGDLRQILAELDRLLRAELALD